MASSVFKTVGVLTMGVASLLAGAREAELELGRLQTVLFNASQHGRTQQWRLLRALAQIAEKKHAEESAMYIRMVDAELALCAEQKSALDILASNGWSL